jgi:hypothetical protein
MVLIGWSQHEFVEKELTILLVLKLMFKYMHILNPKHYACQLVLIVTNVLKITVENSDHPQNSTRYQTCQAWEKKKKKP